MKAEWLACISMSVSSWRVRTTGRWSCGSLPPVHSSGTSWNFPQTEPSGRWWSIEQSWSVRWVFAFSRVKWSWEGRLNCYSTILRPLLFHSPTQWPSPPPKQKPTVFPLNFGSSHSLPLYFRCTVRWFSSDHILPLDLLRNGRFTFLPLYMLHGIVMSWNLFVFVVSSFEIFLVVDVQLGTKHTAPPGGATSKRLDWPKNCLISY